MGKKADDALRKVLESHPDKKTITIAGEEYDFLPGTYGLRLAKSRGMEVDLAKVGEGDVLAVAEYIFSGLLPFDSELDFDIFAARLSIKEISRLEEIIGEDVGEEEGEGAEGK